MKQQQFLNLLKSLTLLTPDQVYILQSSLPEPDSLNIQPGGCQILEAVNDQFAQSPCCPRCRSDHVGGWGSQSGYPRYKCKCCKKTFNALTSTPLAHLRVREKADQYLDCMRGDTTLRVAAKQCDISLPTSFRLRHRIMRIIETDQAELLSGISEIDETFLLESHKGERGLGETARKRGKRKTRTKTKASRPDKAQTRPRSIPIMVACDRQNHITDAVLDHVSADELEAHLTGRIEPGSILCADAHLSHECIARRLNLNLKELVISQGFYVIEDNYHIQHVNAYHSDFKMWINGFFKGVSTKYLARYLGWKRFLKTEIFSEDGLLERISSHWVKPLLS